RTIALQGKPQALGRPVVPAVPLLFQARSLVGETFRESLHHRSYQLVCFFNRPAWFVHETGLYLAPLRAELSHLRLRKQGHGAPPSALTTTSLFYRFPGQ